MPGSSQAPGPAASELRASTGFSAQQHPSKRTDPRETSLKTRWDVIRLNVWTSTADFGIINQRGKRWRWQEGGSREQKREVLCEGLTWGVLVWVSGLSRSPPRGKPQCDQHRLLQSASQEEVSFPSACRAPWKDPECWTMPPPPEKAQGKECRINKVSCL